MFNTLKEIQETLSYDDLRKYAAESLDKSPVEIKELLKSYNIEVSDSAANECYELVNSINIVGEEELENVTGGTCYSSGVANPETGAVKEYVIVTAFNPCPLNGMTDWHADRTCGQCGSKFAVGPTMYCSMRWRGHNTPKVLHEYGREGLAFVDD